MCELLHPRESNSMESSCNYCFYFHSNRTVCKVFKFGMVHTDDNDWFDTVIDCCCRCLLYILFFPLTARFVAFQTLFLLPSSSSCRLAILCWLCIFARETSLTQKIVTTFWHFRNYLIFTVCNVHQSNTSGEKEKKRQWSWRCVSAARRENCARKITISTWFFIKFILHNEKIRPQCICIANNGTSKERRREEREKKHQK